MNDIYYFHLDVTNLNFASIQSGLASKFSTVLPSNILSVNMKNDGTEALIKLVAESGWFDSLEASFIKGHPALLGMYTPDNHDLAVDLVTNVAWTG